MNGICIRNQATVEEVNAVELPLQTDTYTPVPHSFIIDYVENEVNDMLGDKFTLRKNSYGLSWHGQAIFGMACFENSSDYLGLNVAYRNSYNKEFSLGFAFGAQVFVCENGMLTGDVILAKKHTVHVFESFKQVVSENIYKADSTFETMITDVDNMREKNVSNNTAYSMLGVLRGLDVLSPRVFEKAMKEYHQPSFAEHQDGSMMQVYNACTEAMKNETYPDRAMQKRIKLHDVFTNKFLNQMP